MPRPFCCRRISGTPAASVFKPAGIPARTLEQVVLALDEFEAIRLADLQGLYQDEAAERMRVSRPTFGRIIESARRKVAEALIMGKALRIEGGPVHAEPSRTKRCEACGHESDGPVSVPSNCPRCHQDQMEGEDDPLASSCGGRRRRRRKLP
jgi:predicted DNA-binding protein (UPF0251 family)